MTDIPQILKDNLQSIQERIAAAANSVQRDPAEIQLVAVSKYVDASLTAALLSASKETLDNFALGESRPQQLWDKAAQPELADAPWHLIGHLQRNKVQRTAPLVDLIHSVDSLRLLKAIHGAANEQNRTVRILLEVNCSGDQAKHGLTADGLKELLSLLPDYPQVQVCGLMTMAARDGGTTIAEQNFASLRELRDQVAPECPPDVKLSQLSMGMSHDFEAAIRQGATHVRIGSLLFTGIR